MAVGDEWDVAVNGWCQATADLLDVLGDLPPDLLDDPDKWRAVWARHHAHYPVGLAPDLYPRAVRLFKAGCKLGSVRLVLQAAAMLQRLTAALRLALSAAG